MRLSPRYLLALLTASGGLIVGAASPGATPAAPPVQVAARPAATAVQVPAPTFTASTQRQLLDKYCVACHSAAARTAGLDSARKLTVDSLDVANIAHDAKTWELIARKL